jgi:hypothetical protein
MTRRVVIIAVCNFFVMWPAASHSQDSETRTQAVLDQHKDADPTNSDRSLTSKPRTNERVTSEVPLPRGPSAATIKRIHELEEAQKKIVRDQLRIEKRKQANEVGITAFDSNLAEKNANRVWDASEAGKELRRLKAEAAKAEKAQKNAGMGTSDVPLPRGKHN